jgi:hypothetical protein
MTSNLPCLKRPGLGCPSELSWKEQWLAENCLAEDTPLISVGEAFCPSNIHGRWAGHFAFAWSIRPLTAFAHAPLIHLLEDDDLWWSRDSNPAVCRGGPISLRKIEFLYLT